MPESTTAPRIRKRRALADATPRRAAEAEPEPAAAPTHLGKYELLFELGRGGMGSVHAARTRDVHGVERLLALKRLPKERATKEALAALTAEARITATIDHPNVVDTFELGLDDGTAFLAMRLIEGVPLSRALERAKELSERVPPRLAAWMAGQAARGLGAAHELTTKSGERLPIVHRDVSPANLLVSRGGRLYVVDFGIAKLLGNDIRTVSGVIKGKFAYMSPEQTRGSEIDARSDLFSLGAVLYEMLTGVSPFLAASPAESIYRINHVDPPDVRALAEDVPEDLAAIVRRCLARAPEERFPSAAALADALRTAAKSGGDPPDEADVAAWIERVAGEDLRALRERITEASRRPITEPRPASDPPAAAAVTTVKVEAAPPARGRVRAFAILGLGAAAAIAITAAVLATNDGAPATATTTTPTDSTAEARGLEPAVSSSVAPSVAHTPAASSTPSAPPEPSPAGSLPPMATAPATPSSAPWPRVAPTPATSPGPARSSHKGEPFRTLGG